MAKTIEELREEVESLSTRTTPSGKTSILENILIGIVDKLEDLEGAGE